MQFKINQDVVQIRPVLTGEMSALLREINLELMDKYGDQVPIGEMVVMANLSNPMLYGQKPLSYLREIVSGLANPALLDTQSISQSSKSRIKSYLQKKINLGAYTPAKGNPHIRQIIAKSLQRESNLPSQPSIQNIIMCNGISEAVNILMEIIRGSGYGFMIPNPEYQLYCLQVKLKNIWSVPYYMPRRKDGLSYMQEIRKAYDNEKQVQPKVLLYMNPNNPLGCLLDRTTIHQIIDFCIQKQILLIADQVFKDNVISEQQKFIPILSVLRDLPEQHTKKLKLIIFRSASKGFYAESGSRGSYMFLYNLDQLFNKQFQKLISVTPCSNIYGQIIMSLIADPPSPQNSTPAQCLRFEAQKNTIIQHYRQKAKYAVQQFNKMKYIFCQLPAGSLEVFPEIRFPKEVLERIGRNPDEVYCLRALKQAKVNMWPGLVYNQKDGIYSFRFTAMVLSQQILEQAMRRLHIFNQNFFKEYENGDENKKETGND